MCQCLGTCSHGQGELAWRATLGRTATQTVVRFSVLAQHLPALYNVQVAWLILSACEAPCAQYALRTVPPPLTQDFGAGHDSAAAGCLEELLSSSAALPPLELHSSLRLRSDVRHAPAAYWDVLGLLGGRAAGSSAREPAFAE